MSLFRRGNAYEWRAEYADGTVVSESEVGTFAKVDTTRCVALALLPRRRGFTPMRVSIPLGTQAVFFRRRVLAFDLMGLRQPKTETIATCAGWEGTSGKGCYVFAFEDGSLALTDRQDGV